MKWLFPCLLLCIGALTGSAFTIRGTVTGPGNEPLSYANIYIKSTSNGTSANASGQYVLTLEAGQYELVFQHLGFQQHIVSITINSDTTLDVKLKELEYQIRDVVVNPNEDPAIAVIQKAIKRRKYFLNAVEDYSCDAYVKGLGKVTSLPDRIFGLKIEKQGSRNSPASKGVFYFSESRSKLYYKKPGKFREVIYSSKVSGNAEGFTINSAQDFYFNFYNTSIKVPFVADRPFITPLSDNAFFFYDFKMIGAYKQGDLLINKIQVIPKRKNDPCFSGVISIIEDSWNIHSIELFLTGNRGMRYVDTLKVTQYFIPVKDDLWLPSQQRFDVNGELLGVVGQGYYIGIFSNYQLNNLFGLQPTAITDSVPPRKAMRRQRKTEKKIVKQVFSPEIIKIVDSANVRTPAYWDSIRPLPLSSEEGEDYARKDSLQRIYESKEYKDSVHQKQNRFTVFSVLYGYVYRVHKGDVRIKFPSLLGFTRYNTVEGYNINLAFGVYKEYKKRSIAFEPVFRYGFTNKHFNTMGKLTFVSSKKFAEVFRLSGGKFVSQFNEVQPQRETGNTTGTLLFRNNFMKIYEHYFVKVEYEREFFNGIDGKLAVGYSRRYPMENMSGHSLFFRNQPFKPNGVELPGITGHAGNISRHDMFRIDLALHFTFGRKYVTTPDKRIRIDEKNYPELWLIYKKAIPVSGFSDIDFDLVEAKIEGKIPMKLLGTMFYRLGGGGFPTARLTDYADYRHFYGNFVPNTGNDLLGFFLINYYRHSTNQYFAEAHMEHHFNGFFFNKIPGLRKLKLGEVFGFHFLYTPTRQQYFQLDAGIEMMLTVIPVRIDFVAGFGQDLPQRFGARIGLPLPF